eukprot:scaffold601_cov170-Ochromonas_danica.AAC.23
MESLLLNGDIFSCLKEIRTLTSQSGTISVEDINTLGRVIFNFAKQVFIPIEYAEMLLISINRLMETKGQVQEFTAFAIAPTFVKALLSIIHNFAIHLSDTTMANESSFSSHYCFELAMYMLLGLIESSRLLTSFLKAISKDDLKILFKDIGNTIQKDSLFLTQEMSVEVACRISHFVIAHDLDFLNEILQGFPPILASQLNSSGSNIALLLGNMRPYLNKVNESNSSISSIPFIHFSIKGLHSFDKNLSFSGGWLDICQSQLCFFLKEIQCIIRLDVGSLQSCEAENGERKLQLQVINPPEKILELLKTSTANSVNVTFHFDEEKDFQKAANKIKERIADAKPAAETELSYKFSGGAAFATGSISSVSSPDFAPPKSPHHVAEIAAAKRLLVVGAQDSLIKDARSKVETKSNKPSPKRTITRTKAKKIPTLPAKGKRGRKQVQSTIQEQDIFHPQSAHKRRAFNESRSQAQQLPELAQRTDIFQTEMEVSKNQIELAPSPFSLQMEPIDIPPIDIPSLDISPLQEPPISSSHKPTSIDDLPMLEKRGLFSPQRALKSIQSPMQDVLQDKENIPTSPRIAQPFHAPKTNKTFSTMIQSEKAKDR